MNSVTGQLLYISIGAIIGFISGFAEIADKAILSSSCGPILLISAGVLLGALCGFILYGARDWKYY